MLRHFSRYGFKINFPGSSTSPKLVNLYSTKGKDQAPKDNDLATKDKDLPTKVKDQEMEDKEWLEKEIEPEDPLSRTWRVLKLDAKRTKKKIMFWKQDSPYIQPDEWSPDSKIVPQHVDVLIIGGGAIGSSIAYWLKERASDGLSVAVVEKDPTYRTASSVLSAGGLRQQFSLEENIEMSLFGADFIRSVEERLGIPGHEPVDVQFHPHGYLFLATEAGAETLCNNSKLQNSLGARNIILKPKQLEDRFPWLNTDGIECGCLGLEKEGWFDPWSLLYGFKRKAISMGADYVDGEVKGFTYRNTSDIMIGNTRESVRQGLTSAIVKTPSGEKKFIKFAIAVIAAGAFSARIAEMAQVGVGKGILSIPLPVEPRKRFVYCFHSPDGPGLNTPLTVDPCGAYFRREGLAGHYIAGRSPDFPNEPGIDNLDVDEAFFDEHVWPKIAHRVKSFENLKVKSSWAGFYEFNKFDENGIIGAHPYYHNLYFATGFSGHGIQQAPAVGRAITELIVDSEFTTIDLSRLGFDRFVTLEPLKESNIV